MDGKVAQVVEVCGTTAAVARQLLDQVGGNVETAIEVALSGGLEHFASDAGAGAVGGGSASGGGGSGSSRSASASAGGPGADAGRYVYAGGVDSEGVRAPILAREDVLMGGDDDGGGGHYVGPRGLGAGAYGGRPRRAPRG